MSRGRRAEPLTRADYADLYGPTTEDRVRLADTDLVIEIEADWSGGPGRSGNEMIFGGGKVIRESMGQSHIPRDGRQRGPQPPVDTVITGALILDYWGVVKADVGIRDGGIAAIGKAYNPETMDPIRTSRAARTASDATGEPTNFVVGPRPRSSPATAGSSPRAVSTPTCTSSAPRRSTRRWPRA